MTESIRDPAVQGRTIRFRWTEGPTKGITHEHVFHEDGSVEWRDVAPSKAAPPAEAPQRADASERPAYAAIKVAEEAVVVSYLAASGYTLTVVLNFRNHQLVGFASSAREWFPLRGSFEVVP
jgi:hypothetical protein